MDDVLLNFNEALLVHANRKYNKNIKIDDIDTYLFLEEKFGVSGEEVVSTLNNFFFHADHIEASPNSEAIDVVNNLSKKFDLLIITAKPETLKDSTNEWLNKHYTNMFSELHFANHFGLTEKKRKKSEICQELGIDIFVEDSLGNALDVSSVGIPVLLIDKKWNQDDNLPDLVKRVHSWSEIEKEIENLI